MGGLNILKSVMSNDVKYFWAYRELLASLRLSLRAIQFRFLFFIDRSFIRKNLGKSKNLFGRYHLTRSKKSSGEEEVRWVRNGRLFVALTSILFPFALFLMFLAHQVHHVQFSHYHQVFEKLGLCMECLFALLYGNNKITIFLGFFKHIFCILNLWFIFQPVSQTYWR